jgi:hypothetical protein
MSLIKIGIIPTHCSDFPSDILLVEEFQGDLYFTQIADETTFAECLEEYRKTSSIDVEMNNDLPEYYSVSQISAMTEVHLSSIPDDASRWWRETRTGLAE